MRALIAAAILAALLFIALIFWTSHSNADWAKVAAEWQDASPTDRQWFKGVRSPHGVPCCDVADGHRTTFEWRQDDAGGHFWVPIEGEMRMVPTESIVWNAGNPFDTSVVWYTPQGAATGEDGELRKIFYIRCFVPIGGV